MSMRDCPNGEIRDLLPEFVHDRLPAAEAARVRAHLAECDACRDEAALLTALRGELAVEVPVALSAITAGVLARTTGAVRLVADAPGDVASADVASAPRPVTGPGVRRWLRAAALVVAVGGGSVLVVQNAPGRPGQPRPPKPVVAFAGEGSATGLAFAGGVSDLAEQDLQELEAAVTALEQQPIGDVESSADWDAGQTTEGR